MHFLKLEFSYINQITEIKNTRDVLRDYVSAYLEMMIMAWAPNLFKRKKILEKFHLHSTIHIDFTLFIEFI